MDRGGGRVSGPLGLRTRRASCRARSAGRLLAEDADRSLHSRAARAGGDASESRGRQRHARPQAGPRSHGPAAGARRRRCVRRRSGARCLRTLRGFAPGQPAVRRADGDRVARCGPVRRLQRLSDRFEPAELAVARLAHQGLQRQHAVRSLHDRSARRRHAGPAHPRPDRRHGLQPQPPSQWRGRHHRRGMAGGDGDRSGRDDGPDVDGTFRRLCPLP